MYSKTEIDVEIAILQNRLPEYAYVHKIIYLSKGGIWNVPQVIIPFGSPPIKLEIEAVAKNFERYISAHENLDYKTRDISIRDNLQFFVEIAEESLSQKYRVATYFSSEYSPSWGVKIQGERNSPETKKILKDYVEYLETKYKSLISITKKKPRKIKN